MPTDAMPAQKRSPAEDALEETLGLSFPEGFVWGAATSAFQIEGATTADGRGRSVWDSFCAEPGRVRNGDNGDVAADHYHRIDGDLDLMADLSLHSYRFSIAWPRVVPDGRGPVNQHGLDFYRRLVDGLHQRGITPMAALFHWNLPQALQDQGGWESRDVAYRFADYAAAVFAALADEVPTWLTIDEPKTVIRASLDDIRAGLIDPDAVPVAHHSALAHGRAVQAAAGQQHGTSTARIGPALDLPSLRRADAPGARRPTLAGRAGRGGTGCPRCSTPGRARTSLTTSARTPAAQGLNLDSNLECIALSPVDLLAVQYFFRSMWTSRADGARTGSIEAFWQQIPARLYDILDRVTRDYGHVPISITEEGLRLATASASGAG